MVNDLTGGVMDVLEEAEGICGEKRWPLQLPPTSWLLGYPAVLPLTVASHPHATSLLDCVYNLLARSSIKPEKK